MGSKKTYSSWGGTPRRKLTVIDTVEQRPRHGASKQEAMLHERLRAQANRIAELEEALAQRARGNAGPILSVPVTLTMMEHLGYLTRCGMFGPTAEATARELLQLALRNKETLDFADSQRWREKWDGRKPNGKLRR